MRRYHWLIVVACLVPTPSVAQPPTMADGIAAVASGDYPTALRILRPLAEAPSGDPLAQFFLAALYDTGSGVGFDAVRACGLYLKSATSTNPLARQAVALADVFRRDLPLLQQLCAAASSEVFVERPEESFTLGPDHWVRINASGVVVGFRGAENRLSESWGAGEIVYLPSRYSRLEVTRPLVTARHFIESFAWVPADVRRPTVWTLRWNVYEVVRSQVYIVEGNNEVASVQGDRPPASSAPENIGRLQVNADGDVERVVLGANPRTSIVPYQGVRP